MLLRVKDPMEDEKEYQPNGEEESQEYDWRSHESDRPYPFVYELLQVGVFGRCVRGEARGEEVVHPRVEVSISDRRGGRGQANRRASYTRQASRAYG